MQFTVWRYSGKSRIIVEFVSTVILAIIMHIFVNFVLKDSPDFSTKMQEFVLLETQYHALSPNDPLYYSMQAAYIKYGT